MESLMFNNVDVCARAASVNMAAIENADIVARFEHNIFRDILFLGLSVFKKCSQHLAPCKEMSAREVNGFNVCCFCCFVGFSLKHAPSNPFYCQLFLPSTRIIVTALLLRRTVISHIVEQKSLANKPSRNKTLPLPRQILKARLLTTH